MATLKDWFDARRAAINAQLMYLAQQRELNMHQTEKGEAMLRQLDAEVAATESADRIELGYGK